MALRECFSEEIMFKVGLKGGGGGGEGERHSSKRDQYEQEHGEDMANWGEEGIRRGTEQWETRLRDVCSQVTKALNDRLSSWDFILQGNSNAS